MKNYRLESPLFFLAADDFKITFNSTNDILEFVEKEAAFWKEVKGLQSSGISDVVARNEQAYAIYEARLEQLLSARDSFSILEEFKSWLNSELISKLGLNKQSSLLSKNSTLAQKIKDLSARGLNHLVIQNFYELVNRKTSHAYSLTSKETVEALAMASQYINEALSTKSKSEAESESFDEIKSSFLNEKNEFVLEADELLEEYKDGFKSEAEKGKRLDNVHKKLHQRLMRKEHTEFENKLLAWQSRVEDLEALYEEKLKLDKPAKYWSDKAKDYKTTAFLWGGLLFLGLLTGFIVFGKFFSDWLTGDFKVLNLASFQGAAIFLVTVSTYFYIIRILSKMTLSTIHLSRDAEERAQLTYFYLSLSHDVDIDNETRKMIMQSLFTRTDSGLLGGDSSTVFPSDFSKIVVGSQK